MRHWLRSTWCSFLVMGGLAGCDAPSDLDPVATASEPIAIGPRDRPEALVGSASRRLADVISVADVGREFGLPNFRAPYPDTYWPYLQGGTDARWNPYGRDGRSPIEKVMAITRPELTTSAKMWEFANHGPGARNVKSWCGHCGGWAAAAMLEAPVLHAVFAGPDGRGGIRACREGEFGCVRFEIGDINALLAEIYIDGPRVGIGATCNTPPFAIPRDRVGRVLKEGCAGINPGTLLIAASTLLKRYQTPFAMNAQSPDKTAEIWNQPVYRYYVYDYHPLTAAQATNLVVRGSESGPETMYRWNPAARGAAFVDIGLRFVGENGPNVSAVSGVDSTYEMRVAAVLELDADASDPRASILGGEYLDMPSSHASRLAVPPYLWISRGPGPEVLSQYVGSLHHNPFVRPSVVRQLAALGR